MQRIDVGYLYELGDAIRSIRIFRHRDFPAYQMWAPLIAARDKLQEFVTRSIFINNLRTVQVRANPLYKALDDLIAKMVKESPETISSLDTMRMFEAFDRFEPVLSAELSNLVVYMVVPKGAYDVIALVEEGHRLFPESIAWKVPDATKDIEEGAKALAFELWSAAAFHFHRANEAILRVYYDQVMGPGKRPKNCTMGTMLAKLKSVDNSDKRIVVALDNIKEFHRNPNAHPGEFVGNAEEAISLVSAIRAAMSYMLEVLPIVDYSHIFDEGVKPDVGPHAPPPAIPFNRNLAEKIADYFEPEMEEKEG